MQQLSDSLDLNLTPASVEVALSRPLHVLRLAPEVEARFEAATAAGRTKTLRHFLGFALCADVLAVGLDAWHNGLALGLSVRLGVVAPVLALGWLYLSPRKPIWLQGLLATVPVLCGLLSIAMIGLLLGGRYPELYLSAAGMAAFFVNAAMPLRLYHALMLAIANIIITIILVFLLTNNHSFNELLATLAFNALINLLSLSLNFRQERNHRNAFLYGLRDCLQAEALRAANTELTRLSTTDPLTGLPNRRAFYAKLEQAASIARTDQAWFGVLMIDIDHFKAFNDSAGHEAGDDCLRVVADALRARIVPQESTVARLGGEEFAIVLSGADERIAYSTGEFIRQAVEDCALSHPGLPGRCSVTVSVGVASKKCADQAISDVDAGRALLKQADTALYMAKAAGRNTVEILAERKNLVDRDLAA